MKIIGKLSIVLAVLTVVLIAGIARADEKINGKVKSIDLATRTVVVTAYEGQEVPITISEDDTVTLNKLKEKRIKVDDDIKVKYVVRDGKNVATFFKKPAGC